MKTPLIKNKEGPHIKFLIVIWGDGVLVIEIEKIENEFTNLYFKTLLRLYS